MPIKCKIIDCRSKVHARGLCNYHYTKAVKNGTINNHELIKREKKHCSVQGCREPYHCKGFCFNHYRRHKANGTTKHQRRRDKTEKIIKRTR